jgi:glycerol-3-phosphate dehydrogenase (NAD(P)+)
VSGPGDAVGIVGAGGFGLAHANLVAQAGRPVCVWSTDRDVVARLRRDRADPERLPGVTLPLGVRVTDDPAELAAAARLIAIAVSSDEVGPRAAALGPALDGGHLVLHAVGALIEPDDRRVSELLDAELPALRLGALAGPALPGDMVRGAFAAMVCASPFDEVTAEARRLLGGPGLRLYRSRDLTGVELAAALTGVYSVGIGLVDAIDLGPGTRAVLITRALAEATRIGVAAGGDARTFGGLAWLGNMLVRTSAGSGEHAPGYQYGLAMGRGARPTGRAPQAVRTAAGARRLAARLGQRTPILDALVRVLDGEASIREVAGALAETVAQEE